MDPRNQSSVVRKRAQRLDKLISSARNDTNDTEASELELANHLCRDYEVYDPLQRVLKALDPTLIPLVPISELKTTSAFLSKIGHTADCLSQLATILQALDKSPRTEALDAYKDRAYPMVIQVWSGVTKWISYLIWYGIRVDTRTMDITGRYCLQIFLILCFQAQGNAYKEELLSQANTVDILFALLRYKDQERGRFWDWTSAAGSSVVATLLQRYCTPEAGRSAVTGRLLAMSRKTRLAVTESILLRAHEVVLGPEAGTVAGWMGISLIIDTVYYLVREGAVYCIFDEQDFLVRFTQDLCLLSGKEAATMTTLPNTPPRWYSEVCAGLTQAFNMCFYHGRHPSRHLAAILRSSLLRCAFECLSISASLSGGPMVDLLHTFLPYLYTAKALLIRQHAPELSIFSRETSSFSAESLAVWSAWRHILHNPVNSPFTEWKNRQVMTCDNLKCPKDPNESQMKLRVCSACRVTLYCCADCQAEDWRNLHSRECHKVAGCYSGSKARFKLYGGPMTMRKTYLKLLVHFSNNSLPPASDDLSSGMPLNASEQGTEIVTPSAQRRSMVWAVDALHKGTLDLRIRRSPVRYPPGHKDVWQERSQQIALLAQLDPQVVLVEGFFQDNHTITASPFAAMRYSPDAPENQKYSIIHSLLRVGRTAADLEESRALQADPNC